MLDNITTKLGAKKPSEQLACNVQGSYQIDLDSLACRVMNKLTRQAKINVRREADNVTPQSQNQTHIVIILKILKGRSDVRRLQSRSSVKVVATASTNSFERPENTLKHFRLCN